MDPVQMPTALSTTPIYDPGVFDSLLNQNDFLDSLDSDLKDFVINHPDQFRSRDDILEFINRAHSGN